jgi:hypothetical protein
LANADFDCSLTIGSSAIPDAIANLQCNRQSPLANQIANRQSKFAIANHQ